MKTLDKSTVEKAREEGEKIFFKVSELKKLSVTAFTERKLFVGVKEFLRNEEVDFLDNGKDFIWLPDFDAIATKTISK